MVDIPTHNTATCPRCNRPGYVVDGRPSPKGYRRRRECESCNHRWTTYEIRGDILKNVREQLRDEMIRALRSIQ